MYMWSPRCLLGQAFYSYPLLVLVTRQPESKLENAKCEDDLLNRQMGKPVAFYACRFGPCVIL